MDQNKGKIGFTAGNFDIVHPGYIYTFESAKKECDYFMVFLHADPSETRNTKYKPVIPLHERYKTLMALRDVDEVVTYIGKRFTGDHLPIEVVYTTRSHGWSTTKLKNMITRMTIKQNPSVIHDDDLNDVANLGRD